MSLIGSQFGNLAGMQTVVETFEQSTMWGGWFRYWTGGYIDPTASDPTNTPTWELRPGLVMGKITATGTWANYSPTATNGTNVAQGVLTQGLRMQDIYSGVNTAKFYAIMVSGGIRAVNMIGLDLQARQQLSSRFIFDDTISGNQWFDYLQFQTKTANYTVAASDNYTVFDNTGATGEVDFTLPAIANGYKFGFHVTAGFTVKVISNEGANMVAYNNASANSVAFSTGSQLIGGFVEVFSNPAGTKWWVVNNSAGANTITVA